MKGDREIIKLLNSLLANELSSAHQYLHHAEVADDWDYDKLRKHFQKRASDELKHAESLVYRIQSLRGKPITSGLQMTDTTDPRQRREATKIKADAIKAYNNAIIIGPDVSQQLANEHLSKKDAIKAYSEGISLCNDRKDFATRDIFRSILEDEDRHIDQIEEMQEQISQMTIGAFLRTQV
ncbi:MAG: ferritin-like domain-containing protein [Smithellaceae bacterium]|nr:ferritin-like domain-containing protein [Smithellaceae bacterium]